MADLLEKNVKLADLKENDEVILSYRGKVSSVNTMTGFVHLAGGRRIRMTNGTGWDAVANGTCFTASRVKPPLPDFKAGQVWSDNSGTRYFILNGGSFLKAYTTSDRLVVLEELGKKSGLKMVFDAA